MKLTLNYPKSTALGFFQGAQEWVRNSHGKQAISDWATEDLLYTVLPSCVVVVVVGGGGGVNFCQVFSFTSVVWQWADR